ncbi:hypothetical protein ALC60_13852 [Trachymyrmex zeteki]|uniref:Uncharacterized protein n=1 Tax=Mycetomoellerius zeteki TaxID=64791 RepID=A0A151WGZ0_9HYME|nr:hypothetical protein ALC60_13852 [Trachymyrmex zeteki]
MKIAINKGLSGELLFQKSSKRCAVSKSTLCCTVKIIKQNDEVNLCSKSRCKKTFDEFYELLLKEYVVNLSNRCMPLTKWLQHFIKFSKPTAQKPILLILDDHCSHLIVTNFAKSHYVDDTFVIKRLPFLIVFITKKTDSILDHKCKKLTDKYLHVESHHHSTQQQSAINSLVRRAHIHIQHTR